MLYLNWYNQYTCTRSHQAFLQELGLFTGLLNPASSNLLTSYRMVLHLSDVCLLSFCLIDLYDGSMPNLFSITSLGIPGISDIFHAKTSRLSQRKVMSANSYLGSRLSLIRSFLSGLLGSTATSLSSVSMVPFNLLSAFVLAGDGAEADAILVPFDARGICGELSIGVLDTNGLLGVLPPFVLSALAACT
jgi:hypothetical protein